MLGFSAATAQLTSPDNLFLPSADCWKAGIRENGKERQPQVGSFAGFSYRGIPQSPQMLRATTRKSRTKQGTSQPV